MTKATIHMQSPKEALLDWKQWKLDFNEQPIVLKKIKTGLTNQNYIIASGEFRYVLRLNNPDSAALGIDRNKELAILQALAPLNIAPKVVYSDPNNRYTIFEYIKGRVWSNKEFKRASKRQQLAKLIHTYQKINISQLEICQRNYLHYFQHYQAQISRAKLGSFRKHQRPFSQFKRRLRVTALLRLPKAITHHDITPANIIEHEHGITIIDWEYAAVGWPSLDKILVAPTPRHAKHASQHVIEEAYYWAESIWWLIRSSKVY